ncbi:universal stress protein [Winogradskyella sp.]|jgi:nucleotide-binding universal stress UspA family protein|uniref:universal stress protein n=1 Tax=Winogradskyella sp. TaxID=1883156 RepID=UPI0025FA941C|nr:universal stress protein [Winogradskyella sp.]MCT4628637.1 universal stress protein [Winogradskyella sp.]
MKRIIIPVDFSKYSEYALETGAALAKQYDAELIVMHMLELSESIFSASSSARNEETAFMLMVTNKNFEEFLDKPYLEGVNVTPLIKNHKVLKEVAEVAGHEKADLIVMGSRGHSDHDGIFTGSNTEKVVRYSDTPVLVVKSKPNTVNYSNIVLGCDFKEESIPATKNALELLNELAEKVTLLHVNLPNLSFMSTDEINEQTSEFLKLAQLEDKGLNIAYAADHSVEDGVLNHARRENANAVAIITHGRTGLSHFFGGSISEDLVNHSRLPVVTFKL